MLGRMLKRRVARAVLLTPDGRMLLMQVREPSTGFEVWFAPGGGFRPGESVEDCLLRELREETGLEHADVGPLIWRRHHDFTWEGHQVSQDEEFYLVPVEAFDPVMVDNPSPSEAEAFLRFGWWTSRQIAASGAVFAPSTLAVLLESLVRDGPPAVPVDVGV
jgi:8-oxo-dGTP pyrophosphatase MutT (NUDIX family)